MGIVVNNIISTKAVFAEYILTALSILKEAIIESEKYIYFTAAIISI